MSYFFKYNKLIENGKDKDNVNNVNDVNNKNVSANVFDSPELTLPSLTNNMDEFKILFSTQEKLCYEMRAENAILKNKLEISIENNNSQINQIKKLKRKIYKLNTENITYQKIFNFSHNHGLNLNSHLLSCYSTAPNSLALPNSHPPNPPNSPPPPPPPLNFINIQKKNISFNKLFY